MRRGVEDFRGAGRLLQSLPYGRNASPGHPLCVLSEGRGTCSTKHALLARLAVEQDQPIHLALGTYEMCEANTPGVGAVLEQYDLPFVLEAHCYVTFGSHRIDVTRAVDTPGEPISRFLHEERITPDQIGAYKAALHQQMLRTWVDSNPELTSGHGFEEIWSIREACIAALGE